jgi:hypothetical protein
LQRLPPVEAQVRPAPVHPAVREARRAAAPVAGADVAVEAAVEWRPRRV